MPETLHDGSDVLNCNSKPPSVVTIMADINQQESTPMIIRYMKDHERFTCQRHHEDEPTQTICFDYIALADAEDEKTAPLHSTN